MIYIVIACHFKSSTQVCETTIARMEVALEKATEEDSIIVTGDVPFELGSPTLASLMVEWFKTKDHSANKLSILRGGVGTFSEARLTCNALRDKREITVISSYWYLFQGKPIWQRRGKDNGISVSFLSVPKTGGIRTKLTYTAIGVIVRIAIFLGLENILEDFMTSAQTGRLKGFTFNGCK